ncbi:MAG TPA: hypothetical protein VJ852_08225 [Gemmatimonadaceae bacterium]|nr:hypothetical protein [Gemmatimonadaceae bacterium]
MITLCRRAFVSIAATVTMTLALVACASAGSQRGLDRPSSTEDRLLSIRFDNPSRETVDVYLIGTKREWRLGRVAPGAVATLRLPDEAFAEGSMMVRLAVLAGAKETFAAARDPRAVFTITQPATAILSQRWTFTQGSLISVPY